MRTILLTWNPRYWSWDDLEENLGELRTTGSYIGTWSTGKRRDCVPGDRVFLLRQGEEPRGIIASGHAASDVFVSEHWLDSNRDANYVWVCFDAILNGTSDPPLARRELDDGILKTVHWNTQTSGIAIPEEAATHLEARWAAHLASLGLNMTDAEDLDSMIRRTSLREGASRLVTHLAFERNRFARRQCLAHHGSTCAACGVDLAARYGPLASHCIQVHHVIPLSDRQGEYEVNPEHDLVPVCPNCHAVMHTQAPPLTVAEVQKLLGTHDPYQCD